LDDIAAERLGYSLPSELCELWRWWGGSGPTWGDADSVEDERWSQWAELAGTTLASGAHYLPRWVRIESLEQALVIHELKRSADLLSPASMNWLPIFSAGDGELLWAEMDNVDPTGRTPLTLNHQEHYPDRSPIHRFASIADFVEAMAKLVEDGGWAIDPDDPDGGWRIPRSFDDRVPDWVV